MLRCWSDVQQTTLERDEQHKSYEKYKVLSNQEQNN